MERLLYLIVSMRWQDVVDITLTSYILFRLYILFRGTNVFRVLIAIALLWFFERIAVSLGFIVTSWAFQGITAAGALIVIVVFRNEIRSVLQAKNLRAILWGFPDRAAPTPVEIIAESVFDLASRRCGALIVFPGKEALDEVVQSGIHWDGLASREMIMNIFWSDNPVHDGAAVVEGNRVTEVGVILPLSQSRDLPSHYGTRHRAAAGLAENTDALVVIVSEEKGNVVVAKGSKVRVMPSKGRLERTLRDHLGLAEKDEGHLRRDKLEIGLAALASILLIGGVWFSFSRGLDVLTTLEIPIEYMNRDPKMEIVDASANKVHLHLSGSGPLIKSIRPEQVKVRIDLGKAAVGQNTLAVSDENISLPPGIVLKKVEPRVVEVSLDVPIEKLLPIQVDWVGRMPEGLLLADAQLSRKTLLVKGGEHILGSVTTIYTEKVPIDGLRESGTLTVGLSLNPASLKFASGSEQTVTVSYAVKERLRP